MDSSSSSSNNYINNKNSKPFENPLGFNYSASAAGDPFYRRVFNFLQKTHGHALDAPNPGGYYAGIWCRDSSYILRDWVLSGRIEAALNQIAIIWSHQIGDKADGSYD